MWCHYFSEPETITFEGDYSVSQVQQPKRFASRSSSHWGRNCSAASLQRTDRLECDSGGEETSGRGPYRKKRMTRWARANNIHKKKLSEATPWCQMKQNGSSSGAIPNYKGVKNPLPKHGNRPQPPKRKESEWYHKKQEYLSEDVNGFEDYLKQNGQVLRKGLLVSVESEEISGDTELALKKDQRREVRRLKRQAHKKSAMICFHCRKAGHGMDECPEMDKDEQEMGSGICYRCGSTEHELQKCRAKIDPALGEYPFAKCFICGETGHLSRSCPDNPKGLYANGRCCNVCGSVEHFQKDCPDHQNMSNFGLTVGRWKKGMSADYEEVLVTSNIHKTKHKAPKIVNF